MCALVNILFIWSLFAESVGIFWLRHHFLFSLDKVGWCFSVLGGNSLGPKDQMFENPRVRIINWRKVLLKTVCSFISRSQLQDSHGSL